MHATLSMKVFWSNPGACTWTGLLTANKINYGTFVSFFFQISFFSTSPELSNKQRFEYFSRTIPSDHYQTKAMAKIVERLEWKYISIIYEESNYGIKVSFIQLFHWCHALRNNLKFFRLKLSRDIGFRAIFLYYSYIQQKLPFWLDDSLRVPTPKRENHVRTRATPLRK